MSDYMRNRKSLSSVADAYRTMYAKPNEDILNEELIDSLIEESYDEEINEWLEYIDESKAVFSVPNKNKKKIQNALIRNYFKKHPKVKITFGTHSSNHVMVGKGKFVDDNIINFDGSHDDIDNLFKDIQKDKPLMKMMEGSELEEGALADKSKKSGISVGTLRKVYNRGMAAWKTGHRPGTTPQQWGMARVNAFISKKKSGKLNHDQDLAHIVHPDDNMLDESYSKPMPLKTYADKIGFDAKEKKWIMDNEKDVPMFFPNDKLKTSLVLGYPVRTNDYYFAFLTGEDNKRVKTAQEANLKMNLLLQQEYKKALARGGIDFKKEPEKLYAVSGYLWNVMSKAFDKLPRELGAGDTMTRDELYLAIQDLVGEPPVFESYDYQDEIIQEGISGIFKKIANKIRSAKKKVKKRFKLGRKAKDFSDIKEETQLDEVQKVEVDAMKKVSKDMQKVLKAYQAIANKGDKELKNTKHNYDYEQVLKARDTILSMIGKLNTKMIIQQKMKKEDVMSEASAGAMIDKLFKTGGDKMMQYGIAKLLNMTGVGVALEMQKQNPQGFKNTMIAMGKDNKIKLAPNNPLAKRLAKMFKQLGVKPLPEGLEEKVKDGKLDPLSKMGKSKLTGSEINQYYRDNPKQKAAARDKSVKKAIELALDLSGATNYAIKEIEKFKKGLSRHPAVKLALRHANESTEFTGHHVVIENLSPANVIKLKTFGKMMAKMTKLPFDENDPEKSIDKLMGQIWKQKHVPANWERLHKMVAMLRDIGVKMPSLKGKYMGLDPVTKKAIFYKEGTDEIVEWHQKIEDIKEGIEELVEKKEMSAADIKKIEKMTDRNDHTGSLMHLAKLLGDKKGLEALKGIMMTHKALGHMPEGLMRTRNQIYDNLMRQSSSKYSNHKDVISSF